jgi:hypothetical protein
LKTPAVLPSSEPAIASIELTLDTLRQRILLGEPVKDLAEQHLNQASATRGSVRP